MDKHRVRFADSTDENPAPHIFVEVSEGTWIEVQKYPDHEGIHEWDERQKASQIKEIVLAERAFHIGLVQNWVEVRPITDPGKEFFIAPVYEDPVTRQKLEGFADVHVEYGEPDQHGLKKCSVVFVGDAETDLVVRKVHEDDLMNAHERSK